MEACTDSSQILNKVSQLKTFPTVITEASLYVSHSEVHENDRHWPISRKIYRKKSQSTEKQHKISSNTSEAIAEIFAKTLAHTASLSNSWFISLYVE